MKIQTFMAGIVLSIAAACADAQTINPDFGGCYAIRNLRSIPGVPFSYGGITFMHDDPDLLLIGGTADTLAGQIFSIRVSRDGDGIVNGFLGTAQVYADAPNIDGGLAFGPDNVLFFSQYPNHAVSQIKPGQTTPSKNVALSGFLGSSLGTLQFVPPGYPGAGRFKVASYGSSEWCDLTLTPDGNGTFNITGPNSTVQISGSPEGIVYVQPGNPGFTNYSVMISEYGAGSIAAYEVDDIGDPIPTTKRLFLSGFGGTEGGTRDPRTGHFIFCSFTTGDIILITGFNIACPANFNADCGVDDADFVLFIPAYNILDCADPAMPEGCPADLNHDGLVDDADFVTFVVAYNGLICN